MILLSTLCLAFAPVVLVFGYLWASSPADSENIPRNKAITIVSAAWLLAFLFLYLMGMPSGRYGLVLVCSIPAILTYRYFIATGTSGSQAAGSEIYSQHEEKTDARA